MTAHFSDGIVGVPFTADVDLTDWQYRLVRAASTTGNIGKWNHATIGSASPAPIGILLNDPSAGQEAAVQVLGFTKAVVDVPTTGCDLLLGVFLKAASTGGLVAVSLLSGVNDLIVGRFLGPRTTTAGSYYGNVVLTGVVSTAGSGGNLPAGL